MNEVQQFLKTAQQCGVAHNNGAGGQYVLVATGAQLEKFAAALSTQQAMPSGEWLAELERLARRLRVDADLGMGDAALKNLVAHAAARVQAEDVRDAQRLVWAINEGQTYTAQYAAHVLQRGGTGDISDCRAFIDAIAAKEQK